jgi:hypothetical protein
MAVVDVLARLKADTSNFTSAMAKAQKATDDLTKSANVTSSFLGGRFKLALAAASTAAGAFAIKLGVDSVRAAQQAGAAQNRLARLLMNTGGATEAQVKVLNKQAQALEALTSITAENVTVIQSQLATFDLHGSTIGMLTPAILDYVVAEKGASASADEFRAMTNGLAQALNGQFASLTRTGFVLDKQTKEMIKSGTENERAAAIVKVLNTTYRDYAQNALTPAQKAQRNLTRGIDDTKKAFGNALIPIIGQASVALSQTLTPIFATLQAKFNDGKAIERFVGFIRGLIKDIVDFSKAVASIFAPIFTGIIVPAIQLAVGAVIGLIKALGAIGRFIQSNIKVFQALAGVITAVAIGMAAYILQVKLYNAVSKVMLAMTAAKTIATNGLVKAFKMLNLVMRMNPVGLIVAAVAMLAAGFMMLWNRSETFRKAMISVGKAGLTVFASLIRFAGIYAEGLANVVTGPVKLFLKAMSFFSPEAKDAYNKLKDFTNNVGGFFDNAAKKVEGYKDKLDSLNKPIKVGVKPTIDTPTMPDLGLLGSSDRIFGDIKKGKVSKGIKDSLADIMQGYNDYINNDFRKGFEGGAENARDTILRSTEEVKKVFDFMGKELSGRAAAKMKAGYDKLNSVIRGFIPQAEANAKALEEVTRKLEDAQRNYQDVLKSRAEGASELADILRMPFGEASALTRALSSAEADVSSIIGMYDQLVDAINKRYAGIDPAAANRMLSFLELQTKQLIALAKRREKAVAVLEAAQKNLENVLSEQADFNRTVTGNLKRYATALVDLSKADSAAVYNVARTATGYVISQIKASSGGIESITKQLQDRLTMITSFSANIKRLLASGLNEEYVRQLLEAGPETASLTAQALTTASQEQISQINSLYSQINSASSTFGTEMATVFYGNAVSMAQAFVTGAQAEVENINAQMTFIKDSISSILAPLRDEGTSLGTDLALNMMNALEAQRASLVATAKSIADQIVATIAAAFAQLGGITGATGSSSSTAAPAPTSSTTNNKTNTKISKIGDFNGVNLGSRPFGAGNVNVNINTQKVTQTVTSRTVATAVSKALAQRRGK